MNYSSQAKFQDIESKIINLPFNTLKTLLLLIQMPEGLVTKEIAECLGLSRSPALKHAEKLVELGLSKRISIPHRNQNMPPTYRYYLADNIDREGLLQVINRSSTEAKSFSSFKPQQPTAPTSSDDIPEAFQFLLQGVKPSYRGGYWVAFKYVVQNGPVTATEVREGNGWANSVTQSRLLKLIEINLIDREKKNNQFTYHLTKSGFDLSVSCDLKEASEKTYHENSNPAKAISSQSLEQSVNLDISPDSEELQPNMNKNTLDDLVSAVKLLASEVAKLNQRVTKIERNQDTVYSEFSLEDIKNIIRESEEDSSSL